jgi:hypothetical protein
MTETDTQRAIVRALAAIGVEAIRVQCGLARGAKGGRMVLAPPGTPDLVCVSPAGWLEVKAKGGRLSELQERRHREMIRAGARVAVVRSVAGALEVVRRWQEEDRRVERMIAEDVALREVGIG